MLYYKHGRFKTCFQLKNQEAGTGLSVTWHVLSLPGTRPCLLYIFIMANPQKEDGYTAIANEIVSALASIRISGEEMQCLWVILRKTYGWNKKEDSISLSQFTEITGINKRQNVLRALNKLLSKKIIGVIKKDNTISKYRLNKDFETWQPLSKKITPSRLLSKKITGVIKKDNKTAKSVINIETYKNNIKTTITKTKESFKKIWYEKFEFYKNKYPGLDYNLQFELIIDYIEKHPKWGIDKNWNLTIQNWLGKCKPNYYHNQNTSPESTKPKPETEQEKTKRWENMIKNWDKAGYNNLDLPTQNTYRMIKNNLEGIKNAR